jgi:hypothetical protein
MRAAVLTCLVLLCMAGCQRATPPGAAWLQTLPARSLRVEGPLPFHPEQLRALV